MTAATLTLSAFLLQRLDEDEAAALAATEGQWVVALDGTRVWSSWNGSDVARARLTVDADHIARHDPARVLADVAAKRTIVELHAEDDLWNPPSPSECAVCVEPGWIRETGVLMEKWPCPTLRALAAPYADHPDWNETWA